MVDTMFSPKNVDSSTCGSSACCARSPGNSGIDYSSTTGIWRSSIRERSQYRDEPGSRYLPDPEVLALAAEQDRILVSHDFQTMPRHFGDFLQARGSSPGVIVVPQSLPIGEAIEELEIGRAHV